MTEVDLLMILATLCPCLLLLVFFCWQWFRYLVQIPSSFVADVERVIDVAESKTDASLDNVDAFTQAFDSINDESLKRRWHDAVRGFRELGQERAFLNLSSTFSSVHFLPESLQINQADAFGRVLIWIGIILAMAAASVLSLFQTTFLRIIFSSFIIFATASFLFVLYYLRAVSVRAYCDNAVARMSQTIKKKLPHMGEDKLLHTLFLLQKEQSEDLRRQTDEMKQALIEYTTDTLSSMIGSRFDAAITTHLSPAIQKMADVQTDLLHRLQTDQHKRLDQLFTLFTTQVGGLLSQQLSGMAASVSSATSGMNKVVASFEAVHQGMEQTLSQNRDAAEQNHVVLEALARTQTGLAERFSDAALLLDDVMTSMKILADTTGNANTATLMLSEQAARLQHETTEKLEELRTTLSERLGEATKATELQQSLLVEQADRVSAGLYTHTDKLQTSLLQFTQDVKTEFGAYATRIQGSLEAFVADLQASTSEQALKAVEQQKQQTEVFLSSVFLDIRAMEEHTTEVLKQAQAWSLEVSEKFSTSANAIFTRLEKHNQEISLEIQSQGRTNANLLALTNKTLTDTIQNQNKVFEQYSTRLMELLKQDADDVIHSLHQESASLLETLPTQMRAAFDAFTSAMGETMRATLTDSVDIIDRLGEKTAQLHSEFELYFSRTEGNTDKLVDDLRFAMEGSIAKFSEMTMESLVQLRDGNAEAASAFADQTRQLMEKVDEQTATLSLYVKDMGIDMAELNKGLKESVATFSEQLQNGVHYTFQEFDTGLSDIVRRMTELNINMQEAIQALPDTMGKSSGPMRS